MSPAMYIFALALIAWVVAIFQPHRGFLLASIGLILAGLLLPVFVR